MSGPVPRLHLTDAEPLTPQGAYNPAEPEMPLSVPLLPGKEVVKQVELLSPAGGLDAAFAAFHYGADAIYLGLKKFSARAEAENFTLEELDEVIGYAHSFQPRRRVFVTINTLIRQDELAELIEALAALEGIGADAVILQDLGVYPGDSPILLEVGTARQHANGGPQPGRRGSSQAPRLWPRGPGARIDFRRSP